MMNTPPNTLADHLRDDAAYRFVSWIIRMPDHSGALPAGNRIASLILSRFVVHRIEGAGIACKRTACLGEFNFSIHLLASSDPKAAAKIVMEVLASCELLGFARVFWWDAAERVFRCVHPPGSTDRFEDYLSSSIIEELSGADKEAIDALQRLAKASSREKSHDVDPPPQFPPL